MTVKELKELLRYYSEDRIVYIADGNKIKEIDGLCSAVNQDTNRVDCVLVLKENK